MKTITRARYLLPLTVIICLFAGASRVEAQFSSNHFFTGFFDGRGDAAILEFDENGDFVTAYDVSDYLPANVEPSEILVEPLEFTPWGTLLYRTGYLQGAGWFEMDSQGIVVRYYPSSPSAYLGSSGHYIGGHSVIRTHSQPQVGCLSSLHHGEHVVLVFEAPGRGTGQGSHENYLPTGRQSSAFRTHGQSVGTLEGLVLGFSIPITVHFPIVVTRPRTITTPYAPIVHFKGSVVRRMVNLHTGILI